MTNGAEKNILVITYWDFSEAHIQANVLPNLKILSEISNAGTIYLYCLNKRALSKAEETAIQGSLAPYRIRLLWFQYSHFGIKMILRYAWLIPYLCYTVFSKKIEQIYAWCTTAGTVGYLISVVTRRPLILESHEPHAEAMLENGYWSKKSLGYKVLTYFENRQVRRAAYVIAANSGMKEYVYRKYGYKIPASLFFTKPACVDLNQFRPDPFEREIVRKELDYTSSNIVCIYAGKFGGIYLDKEAFVFFKTAYDYWGDKFKLLLLTSHDKDYIFLKCKEAELPFGVITLRFVPHTEVPRYMQAGDFGISPIKPVPTKKYCTPVKDGEYWAMGLPVVITKDISDDSQIIKENDIGAVLEDLSAHSYQKAVHKIDEVLEADRDKLSEKIRSVAAKYRNYAIAATIYRKIYAS